MKIFKIEPKIKFINKRYYAFALSGLIILAGLVTFVSRGFNMGIDFSGGTLIEVSLQENTSVQQLRNTLAKINLGDAQITQIGSENKFFIKTLASLKKLNLNNTEKMEDIEEYEIVAREIRSGIMDAAERTEATAGKIDLNNTAEGEIARFLRDKGLNDEDAQASAQIVISLRKSDTGIIGDFSALEKAGVKHRVMDVLRSSAFLGKFTFLKVEFVGPQVGKELRRKAALACIWALIGMLIYIGFRFKFLYGISGVLTLAHDVLIALSFILFFNIEMSLQVIAALLTIVGYSINDTIVLFDRLRDNVKIMRKDNLEIILDLSINQTLSRTIITSLTVFLTVLSLFFFGGEVIYPFAFTMLVGVVTGTYSTIYQSCAWLKVWEQYFLKRKKS
ncbi:MAG: protein translocase subunit SecF [Acidobacteria bacterium]|nr:protein translocase subunit SecF [Acidobacteriota bacterium]MBU4307119.1 protein translocase subunit SecF [Acidobacteriota bacterium]MCG2812642.1 protein translocase subunit SecF [Candidatus Aminicenantes bacterium]